LRTDTLPTDTAALAPLARPIGAIRTDPSHPVGAASKLAETKACKLQHKTLSRSPANLESPPSKYSAARLTPTYPAAALAGAAAQIRI